MKIENWSIVYRNIYQAPEQQSPCLHKKVYWHPKHKDGTSVITSFIEKEKNGLIITHSGSKYELGEVDSDYEKIYPNAKQRLIDSLKLFS